MKKEYKKPTIEVINLDQEISLLMQSNPPQDPSKSNDNWDNEPTGSGIF